MVFYVFTLPSGGSGQLELVETRGRLVLGRRRLGGLKAAAGVSLPLPRVAVHGVVTLAGPEAAPPVGPLELPVAGGCRRLAVDGHCGELRLGGTSETVVPCEVKY